jgi:hypothetical protein
MKGLSVSYARTLVAITLAALMLGAVAGAAASGGDRATWRDALDRAAGHAVAAIATTVDGVAAARDARRAYRGAPSYVPPYPAPYYPYPNGYPYW